MIVPNATSGGPERRGRAARAVLLALWGAAGVARAEEAAGIERFPLANRAPFTAILGIPTGGIAGGPALELSWDIASHAVAATAGAESLLLDGETHVVTLRWRGTAGPRLALALEVPWVAHGGGFLDRPIDAWHDAFGLPEGIRPDLPHDDLRYQWQGADGAFLLDDATSGIGDVRTTAALRVAGSARGAAGWGLDVTADAEWPTGDADRLTGSGGTDLAAGLRLESPPAAGGRLGWSAGAGVAWPGDVDLPLPPAAGHVVYWDAALAWAAWPSLDLLLQAQGHGGAWESGLDVLGDPALMLGGGFAWRLGAGFSLRFGVFEDVRTETSPDFSAQLALAWRR